MAGKASECDVQQKAARYHGCTTQQHIIGRKRHAATAPMTANAMPNPSVGSSCVGAFVGASLMIGPGVGRNVSATVGAFVVGAAVGLLVTGAAVGM